MLGAWLLIVFVTGFVGLATISAALVAVLFLGVTALPEQSGLFVFALRHGRARSSMRTAATSGACSTAPSRGSRRPAARWLRRGQ